MNIFFCNNCIYWFIFRHLLLTLLFGSSSQLIEDTIEVSDKSSCGDQVFEIDNDEPLHLLRIQTEKCTSKSNITRKRCMATFRGKNEFIRRTHFLCGYFDSFLINNCDTKLKIGYTLPLNQRLHETLSCSKRPQLSHYCAPLNTDLQVILKKNNLCILRPFDGYVKVRLKSAFPTAYHLDRSMRCPSYPITRYETTGTIQSQYWPDQVGERYLCEVHISPTGISSFSEVSFCIQFEDHMFVRGGAKLQFENHSKSGSFMIFDDKKMIPHGRICKTFPTSIVIIKVVPGTDPELELQHAFLFHYEFKEQNYETKYEPEENHETEQQERKGLKPFQIAFIVIGGVVLMMLIYCCKRWAKETVTDNPSYDDESVDIGHHQVSYHLQSQDPPSYVEVVPARNEDVHVTQEVESPSATHNVTAIASPSASEPWSDSTAPPPEYESLFPGRK